MLSTVLCGLSTVQLHKYPHTASWGCDLLSTIPKGKVLYRMDCNRFVAFLLPYTVHIHVARLSHTYMLAHAQGLNEFSCVIKYVCVLYVAVVRV